MKGKGYNRRTRHLGLPVLWYGDRIIPEQELKKWNVVENMLLGGMGGVRSCVFDDGSYRLEPEPGGSFRVTVSATGASPGAEGVHDGVYFKTEMVSWEGLKAGHSYHLYLTLSARTYEDCSAVRAASLTYPRDGVGLLMAVVDLTSEPGSVNADPDGKLYSSDLSRHVGDSENPHGRKLRQDEVVVSKVLELGPESVVRIGEDEFPASMFPAAVAEVGGRRVERVDLDSPGPSGTVVKVNGAREVWAVVSVHVRASRGLPSGDVGEIGIGYHGEDPEADDKDEFVVYNGGDPGLPLRAVVICV